jgi:hypothetical protein
MSQLKKYRLMKAQLERKISEERVEAVDINLLAEDSTLTEFHEWQVPTITPDFPVFCLFGVGPAEATTLRRLGIRTLQDLLDLKKLSTQIGLIEALIRENPEDKSLISYLSVLQQIELDVEPTFHEMRSRLQPCATIPSKRKAAASSHEGKSPNSKRQKVQESSGPGFPAQHREDAVSEFLEHLLNSNPCISACERTNLQEVYISFGREPSEGSRDYEKFQMLFRVERLIQLMEHAEVSLSHPAIYYQEYRTKWSNRSVPLPMCRCESEKDKRKLLFAGFKLTAETCCQIRQCNPFAGCCPLYEELSFFQLLPFERDTPLNQLRMEFVLSNNVQGSQQDEITRPIKLPLNEIETNKLLSDFEMWQFDQSVWYADVLDGEEADQVVSIGELPFFETLQPQHCLSTTGAFSVVQVNQQYEMSNLLSKMQEYIARHAESELEPVESEWIVVGDRLKINDSEFQKISMSRPQRIFFAEPNTVAEFAGKVIEETCPWFPNDVIDLVVSFLNDVLNEDEELRKNLRSVSNGNLCRVSDDFLLSDTHAFKWHTFCLNEAPFFNHVQRLGEDIRAAASSENFGNGTPDRFLDLAVLINRIWGQPYLTNCFLETSDLPSTRLHHDTILPSIDEWWRSQFAEERLKTKPFSYQRKQVYCMANLENILYASSDGAFRARISCSFIDFHKNGKVERIQDPSKILTSERKNSSSRMLFDRLCWKLIPRTTEMMRKIQSFMPKVSFKGGILADENKLGKFTLSCKLIFIIH